MRFLLVIVVIWLSWMFRFEHIKGEHIFLDRWTGELVYKETDIDRAVREMHSLP